MVNKMNINNLIKELLVKHECVIIPELGGFVTNYSPARNDYELNVFEPPRKNIVFNSLLTSNDGLLINSVADSNKSDYKAAKTKIEHTVSEWKSKLEKGENIVFIGLGKLYFDQNQKLCFEPDNSENYLLDSYGFNSFRLSESSVKQKVEENFAERAVKMPVVRKVLIAVPVMLVLALTPFTATFLKSPNTSQSSIIESINFGKKKEKMHERQTKELPVIDLKVAEEPKVEKTQEQLPKTDIEEIQVKKFYIIAGSFKNKTNAIKLKNELTGKGHKSDIITYSDTHRVYYGEFADKNDAELKLIKVKSDEQASAWILAK